jgi:hypothetical protein
MFDYAPVYLDRITRTHPRPDLVSLHVDESLIGQEASVDEHFSIDVAIE